MTMKKFINAPDSFVDEALEGIVMAHEDKVMLYPADSRVVMRARRDLQGNKVGIVTGGGFGHLPVMIRFHRYTLFAHPIIIHFGGFADIRFTWQICAQRRRNAWKK